MTRPAASVIRPSVDVGLALEALTAEVSRMCRLIEERMPPPPPPRAWLTVKEASRLTGREEQTVTWCRSRRKIGGLLAWALAG